MSRIKKPKPTRTPEPAAKDKWIARRMDYAGKKQNPPPEMPMGRPEEKDRAYLTYGQIVVFRDPKCKTCSGEGAIMVTRKDEPRHVEVCGCALNRVLEIPGMDLDDNTKGVFLDLRHPEIGAMREQLDNKTDAEQDI